ncbi:amidase [Rhodococcus sp. HM1]|uniref:amidase n=1 Tax=unclassified Rhodococcus (in: high G+C Gram-positive bacteria) TaxID=192944 RepID=UPI0018CF6335|nr:MULTISPECIES: amidase [unclassified Rhodococcus (in: high G+C Gram-positive bacteria)]MBH0118125.1 amidase [Rhodococcus sp. CX]MCK8670630.1 amidase [Rhodococcus sp. HM1]
MAENPLHLPIRELTDAYARGDLNPIDVTEEVLDRIERFDPEVRAYVTVTADLARFQAADAADRYSRGERAPLLGVPVSIKDAFHLADTETGLGSLTQRGRVARSDSGAVARLRAAGSVMPGKTSVPEFCQSATSDNLLGPETGNPWDPTRTPGGSSGGAAASVGAGLATIGLGSDGGGSIRIPAAFSGLVGYKPTTGLCADERGFRAMTDFVTAGPLAWTVDDARIMTEILAETSFARASVPNRRIAFCPRPDGRPVDPAVVRTVEAAASILSDLGHEVVETDIPIHGWNEIFGPLVLDDELRERAHLLERPELLTPYERASLRAAEQLTSAEVALAREALGDFRRRVDSFLHDFDAILTPTVATVAFPHEQRPKTIDGEKADWLWGAFPFTSPFNVAATPAISLPAGTSEGLPIGVQLVTARGRDADLLNLAESLESALGFDYAPVRERWASRPVPEPVS